MSGAARKKTVASVTLSHKQREGAGFVVRRPFPSHELDHVGGVFLMLDHMGPVDYAPGEAVGAPDHPHRGFETVSYILEGAMQHKDSAGNKGTLGPGWVQWMTAGSGVVHSETPSDEMMRTGGRVEGFQLWVNLKAKDKFIKPRYQDVPPERIPEATPPGAKHPGSKVKVIAGESCGISAVIDTHTPISYLDVRLAAGDVLEQAIPKGWASFAYVYRGAGFFGNERVRAVESNLVRVDEDCEVFRIEGAPGLALPSIGADSGGGVQVLLIGGEPISEPIVRRGPFVLNTVQQLQEAFDDYRSGRMGSIEGAAERRAEAEAARRAQEASGTWSKDSREL